MNSTHKQLTHYKKCISMTELKKKVYIFDIYVGIYECAFIKILIKVI